MTWHNGLRLRSAPNATVRPLSEFYPDAPGFKSDGPSRRAAEAMAATARTLRQRVLSEIVAAPTPLTADEIANRLAASVLSIRPRVSELKRLGQIVPADERGRNESGMTATRWKVAPRAGERGIEVAR